MRNVLSVYILLDTRLDEIINSCIFFELNLADSLITREVRFDEYIESVGELLKP